MTDKEIFVLLDLIRTQINYGKYSTATSIIAEKMKKLGMKNSELLLIAQNQ